MTRRSRRSSSAPRQVGSDVGLTSSRPRVDEPDEPDEHQQEQGAIDPARATGLDGYDERGGDAAVSGRHTPRTVDQTKDDTDEGWGERGDAGAAARWLRENRPPHWD